ncbi:S6 family peptidase [Edwardsiella ictaluri]|uniref:S6 family peptidase n=1 Tax=Edwardsiella ictaluri TaxID=67780 RepID=UPI002F2B380A
MALLLLGGLAVPESYASIVSDEIPYSVFRDFAENKGVFQPGATDIAIYDKSGAKVGTLDLAPFPDFSSASTNTGFATLIAPQFIAGVAHNGGYTAVSFGYGNNYRLLDRNNHPDFDFHVPRLNKIVTEVVPIPMTTAGIAPGTYQNIDRFPVFYHIGSGVQYTKERGGALHRLSDSYQYLTGGTIGRPSISDTSIVSNPGDTFNPAYGPLANYSAPGDSGSPLYGYDAQEGRWVLVAVTRAYAGESGTTNWWVVVPVGFVQAEMAKYSDPAVTFQAGEGALHWTYDNSTNLGTLSQQGNSTAFTMHGQAGTDPNAGKSLTFTSDSGTTQGEIILESSINQGAGVLTFDADYAVRAQDQQTWMGGGLIISADKTLDWQVNGVSNDNLHRLGEGTLHINGQGVNPGGLNVGDGLTLLDQRPDAAGHVQAFSSLNIASGRPTVKLMADGQIDPDSISWGFRGGVLDLNGHDMAFQMLRMADYGARVTNSADARAQLSLNYQPLNYLSAVAYPLRGWTDARVGTPGDLYRYENGYTNTVDYFLLNTSGNYGYFPTNQTSNGPWTYLGHDEAGARQTLMLNEQRRNQIIHGQFSDNLDIVNIAEPGMTGTTVFDGSMAITGDFSQRGGSLQFQGHPVTHARDFSAGRPPVSADQPDWEARSFALNTLMLTQADFSLARNAVLLGDIQADASRVILNSNRVFVDSRDGEGVTSADTDVSEGQLSAEVVARSEHQGNILLENRSILAAGGLLSGAVTAANSLVALMADSEHTGDIATGDSLLWLAPGAVQQGDLQLGGASDLTSLGAIVGNLSVDASNVLLERGSQLLGDITLAGNAALTSRGQTRRLLSADASAITLENGAEQQGDIRLDNGASLTSQGLTEGLLSADASTIMLESGAEQQGDIRLGNGASLTSQGLTEGLLSADASIIILENGALQQGEVRLDKGAMLTSQGGIVGNLHADASTLMLEKGAVQLGDLQLGGASDLTSLGKIVGSLSADASNVLLERGSQLLGDITLAGNAALTSRGETRRLLSADASAITLENGAEQQGDIRLDNGASLTSQGLTEGLLSADASSVTLQTGGRHTGVVTLNNGATLTIQAPVSEVESTDVGGQLRGDVILTAASSLISAGSIDGKLRAANSSLYLQQGSLHQGDIALSDGATLALNGRNQGAIDAEASLLTLGRSAGQMGDVALSQSLLISEGRSQGAVSLSDSGAYFGQDSQH